MAAPAFVQVAKGTANSTTPATSAFVNPTVSGNFICVVITTPGSAANVITSVTDTAGNTYRKAYSILIPASTVSDVWYASNIVGGSSQVVTVHQPVAFDTAIVANEYSGLLGAVDVYVTANGFSSACASGSTATTTMAVELVIGALSQFGGGVATVGAGYTNLNQQASGTSNTTAAQQSKAVAATGTQSTAFALAGTGSWGCGCIAIGPPRQLPEANLIYQAVNRSYSY